MQKIRTPQSFHNLILTRYKRCLPSEQEIRILKEMIMILRVWFSADAVVGGTDEIDKKLEKLSKELEIITVSVSEYVNKNASEVLSQDEYINEYTKLTKKYEKE